MLASLALAALAAPLPQAPPIRLVISRGDTMPDGGRVEFLDDWAINDAGQILIVARSLNQVSRLILDDQILFRLGDEIAPGVTFRSTRGIDIRNGGDWIASVETSLGSALLLNGNIVALAGDVLSAVALPGIPAGERLLAFGDNPQWSSSLLTIMAEVGAADSPPTATYRLVYRIDPGTGTLALESGTKYGDVITNDGDTLRQNFGTFVDADGTVSELSSVLTPGNSESSVLSVGGVVQVREGDPAPVPGQTLYLTPVAHASFAPRGAWALEATHRPFPGWPLQFHLFKNGALVLSGGDPAPDGSGYPLFNTSFGVQLASDGTMVYDLMYPMGATGEFVYLIMADGEIVLSTARDLLPSGDPLPFVSMPKAVDGLSPDGTLLAFETGTSSGSGRSIAIVELEPGRPGACQGTPNSTGSVGRLDANGSSYLDGGGLTLIATNLPGSSFCQVLLSRAAGFVSMPGGSLGHLCLGAPIGRILPPNPFSDGAGRIEAPIDLTSLAQPSGAISASPGESWYFQVWHRDSGPAGATSNFTRSYEVLVR